MRFTINNIFETNILNLIVVIAIVVKVIGKIANSFLTTRKKRIIEQFMELDTKENIANIKLINAQLAVKTAKKYCCIIREQGQQILEVEKKLNNCTQGGLSRANGHGQCRKHAPLAGHSRPWPARADDGCP